jgi:hypothetical protein
MNLEITSGAHKKATKKEPPMNDLALRIGTLIENDETFNGVISLSQNSLAVYF